MLTQYHLSITRDAIGENFSPRAMDVILASNIHQDSLAGQFNHPEYHYDDCAFREGDQYIISMREGIMDSLRKQNRAEDAWNCFGKLTHVSQDYYAHSNYIRLWSKLKSTASTDDFPRDDILLPEIVAHDHLASGRFYSPWEMITFIPWIGHRLGFLFPSDSHARFNIDSPDRSNLFPQVYQAAVYRTVFEYNEIVLHLSDDERRLFSGKYRGI
jgi:hypothetical protein